MQTIALLPLDNRPPNYDFPARLARIPGVQILLPPREFSGGAHHSAQQDSLERWLLQLPPVDAVIVSIDALAFGGLAQSRQLNPQKTISTQDAESRLKVLLQFREQRPDVPLYAFNVLMRLGITMDSDAVSQTHFNLQRYSRLMDEANAFDSTYLREQLAEVIAQIPPKVLSDYLALRRRNHEINLWALRQSAAHKWNFLSLAQEDCAEFGLHRAEQKKLLLLIEELKLQQKVSLHPGTDEAAMVLAARLWNNKSTFDVHWSDPQGAQRIPPYEDRPFRETVAAQLAIAQCEESADADFTLFINAPAACARDRQTPEQAQHHQQNLQRMVDAMTAAAEEGKRIALCDAAFPNGADDALMSLLDKRNLLGQLCAFAAWNTASNALGTVITQCTAFAASHFEAQDLNRQFVLERILDDWIYQTRLRPQMQNRARLAEVSSLRLGEFKEELRKQLERELRGYGNLIAKRHFNMSLGNLKVDFPWDRTFEIQLTLER